MLILFWALTVSTIGKALLALGVILAHSEIAHEHRIDARVLRSFKRERWLTIIGLGLIVLGYILEMYFYGFTPFADCQGTQCAALLSGVLSQ